MAVVFLSNFKLQTMGFSKKMYEQVTAERDELLQQASEMRQEIVNMGMLIVEYRESIKLRKEIAKITHKRLAEVLAEVEQLGITKTPSGGFGALAYEGSEYSWVTNLRNIVESAKQPEEETTDANPKSDTNG